jgi:ribonuclease P/MRP protein subunit POP1
VVWLFTHPAGYERASAALTKATISILEIEKKQGIDGAQVEIADLRGHFNMFDLMGPKSSQVIRGAFTLEKNQNESVQRQVKFSNSVFGGTLSLC